MKHDKITGKAAEDNPWINNLTTPKRRPVAVTRGENRKSRRAKDKEVRLELKRIAKQLPNLKPGTEEYIEMDLRKGELDLYQASPHAAVNKPYEKKA